MPSVGQATTNLKPVVQTAAYTANRSELVLANAATAAFTVTLPTAPGGGAVVGVKKTDSSANAVTVVGSSGVTIDGDATATLLGQDWVVNGEPKD